MHMQAKPSAGPRPAATHKPPSWPAPARATRSAAWPAPRPPPTLREHAGAIQSQRQRPMPALPQPRLAPRGHAHAIRPALPARAARSHAEPAPAPFRPACERRVDFGSRGRLHATAEGRLWVQRAIHILVLAAVTRPGVSKGPTGGLAALLQGGSTRPQAALGGQGKRPS